MAAMRKGANVAGRERGLRLPLVVRAAIPAGCWLQFVATMLLIFPGFMPIFSRLSEMGELPSTSAWFLAVGRLNQSCWGLPMLAWLALLIAADAGVAQLARRKNWPGTVYRCWFSAVAGCGLLALLLLMVALLLPAFTLGSTPQ